MNSQCLLCGEENPGIYDVYTPKTKDGTKLYFWLCKSCKENPKCEEQVDFVFNRHIQNEEGTA